MYLSTDRICCVTTWTNYRLYSSPNSFMTIPLTSFGTMFKYAHEDICQRLRGRKIWVCPGGATQDLPPSPALWWQVLGCATETSTIFRPA